MTGNPLSGLILGANPLLSDGALAVSSADPAWEIPPSMTIWTALTHHGTSAAYQLVGNAYTATSWEIRAHGFLREGERILAGEQDPGEEPTGILVSQMANIVDALATALRCWNDQHFYLTHALNDPDEVLGLPVSRLIEEVHRQIDRLWSMASRLKQQCITLCAQQRTPVPTVISDCTGPYTAAISTQEILQIEAILVDPTRASTLQSRACIKTGPLSSFSLVEQRGERQ